MYDVIIIGGGPAGLAAAVGAHDKGASCVVIEREKRIGGILKQCIHDGFGLVTFKERLTGPEYAERYIRMMKERSIKSYTSTFVTEILKENNIFKVTLINRESGLFNIEGKTLILANGCRERTSKQVFINGTRPAGVYNAGTAQYLVNISGYLPCSKCVILGSGDIGLIMARRLTLEGCKVEGVFEAKSSPSGLTRNIVQCLQDYNIPLHLSKTVTKIFGEDRVEGVEICSVDERMTPIKGTEEIIECDGLILSVGLIPENEIAEALNIEIDPKTKGPVVDHNFMTSNPGVFSCGNALHVNDLVDYVSESGKLAGESAVNFIKLDSNEEIIKRNRHSEIVEKQNYVMKNKIKLEVDNKQFLYVVPQYIDTSSKDQKAVIYFRSKSTRKGVTVTFTQGEKVIFKKKYKVVRPPEMERVLLDIDKIDMGQDINISME